MAIDEVADLGGTRRDASPPSSPPPNPAIASNSSEERDEDMDFELSKLPQPTTYTNLSLLDNVASSDPLNAKIDFNFTPQTKPHPGLRTSGASNLQKRTLESNDSNPKRLATSQRLITNNARLGGSSDSLVNDARGLLIQAVAKEKNFVKQSRLLDLLEVFRDYTEKGLAATSTTSNVLASQVNSLEKAIKKLETPKTLPIPMQVQPTNQLINQAKNCSTNRPAANQVSPSSSYASALNKGKSQTVQDWQTVSHAKKPSAAVAKATKASNKKDLRLVLTMNNLPLFSPFDLRNKLNTAFLEKGIKEPVIASISTSLNKNIVLTTTPQFNAEFLLEKKAIWSSLISYNEAQKDTSWYKVICHGIPLADFAFADLEVINDEIKTFNKGYKPIGTPHWLTSREKREGLNQRAGSIVIAFSTDEEAKRAIKERLYIAGISVRCEKYIPISPTFQCPKCQGFGHLENRCKKAISCKLCSEQHSTKRHTCNTCDKQGTKCLHLAPKCTNCKESHTADDKRCSFFQAIKQNLNNDSTQEEL